MITTTALKDATVVEDMNEQEYHSHPALSQSLAKLLLPPSTPAHFWWRRNHAGKPKKEFDLGHVAHELVLGKGAGIAVVDAEDWRTKAAREARDAARAEGKAPVLAKDHAKVLEMVAAIDANPKARALLAGTVERSVFWERDGISLRSRIDCLPNLDTPAVVDYKTTTDASLRGFSRSIFSYGYVMQGAWYLEAAQQLGIEAADYALVAQEVDPPYCVAVFVLTPEQIELGRHRMQQALDTYRRCLEADEWPGYTTDFQTPILPSWAWEESA